MLNFIAAKEGSTEVMLVLGITAETFAMLLAGNRIDIDPKALGLKDWPGRVILVGGTTEDVILERVTRQGAQVDLVDGPEEARQKVEEHIYGTNTH